MELLRQRSVEREQENDMQNEAGFRKKFNSISRISDP